VEERIRELETISRVLEPDAEERASLFNSVSDYAEAFLESMPERLSFVATEEQGINLLKSPLSETPLDIDAILQLIQENVDHPGINEGTQGFLAFIPAGGLYASALGDYLAAITNRYSGLFFASPGAVRVDRMVLRWLADEIGYPETSAGDISSGGSIANLEAIVTSREAHDLHAKEYHRTVVYLTKQAHHSIEKALRIAGLKECIVRYIPLDEQFHIRVDILQETIENDKIAGLNPWLIVASAGTTDTGAVDPLNAIADIAEKHKLWLHVDAAYGGMFVLCEAGREKLQGMNRADSVTIDQHKGLSLALGIGTVLVKEGQHLLKAHYYNADYLQDADALASSDEISPAELSPELTRPHRGLRIWLPLKLFGIAPFRALLEEKLLLAQHFYEKIQTLAGFEVGPAPDLSIVTFRYIPKTGDVNVFNQQLINAIQTDGRIFLSSTMIDGKFTIRMAILSFRTHLSTIDMALEILQEKAKMLEAQT
jgi:aromatic-L-amino-acid/L-tryptophan decarboxylase